MTNPTEDAQMVADAIEWLNEIRCWINRCKDTEWGDDDQCIVDFITKALQQPAVEVHRNICGGLKPCPFCGGEPKKYTEWERADGASMGQPYSQSGYITREKVRCSGCGVTTWPNQWNIRFIEVPQIEGLREAIDAYDRLLSTEEKGGNDVFVEAARWVAQHQKEGE